MFTAISTLIEGHMWPCHRRSCTPALHHESVWLCTAVTRLRFPFKTYV